MDFQKFLQGKAFDAYEYFGAHLTEEGAVFRVYAPNAANVEVQGDFSGWKLLPETAPICFAQSAGCA